MSNFFRQHSAEASNNLPKNNNNLYHAQLAAKICISLGKAHCAAVHTEGDLHLMSSYNRGAVPVERQLAQLLHEVPHFRLVTGNVPGSNDGEEAPVIRRVENEVFSSTKLTMQESESLAKS
eukprot:13080640-Ditylum_brightwellii.AAC.1